MGANVMEWERSHVAPLPRSITAPSSTFTAAGTCGHKFSQFSSAGSGMPPAPTRRGPPIGELFSYVNQPVVWPAPEAPRATTGLPELVQRCMAPRDAPKWSAAERQWEAPNHTYLSCRPKVYHTPEGHGWSRDTAPEDPARYAHRFDAQNIENGSRYGVQMFRTEPPSWMSEAANWSDTTRYNKPESELGEAEQPPAWADRIPTRASKES